MEKTDYKLPIQAEEYQKMRFLGGLELVNKDETNLIKKYLSLSDNYNKVCLDLGTGTGRIIEILFSYKPKVIYALDKSLVMLNVLKKIYKVKIKNGLIKPLVDPSDKIRLNGKSIDIAISFHLFKHLRNIRPTLQEAHRVLKADGILIFDVLNKHSIVNLNLGTCFAKTEEGIIEDLKDAGFIIQKISYLHFFGETIYKLLGKRLSVIIQVIDKILTKTGLKFGTKILILARKV